MFKNKYKIDINKLYVGQVFKNYKVMCEELGQPYIVSSKGSRNAQIKELCHA